MKKKPTAKLKKSPSNSRKNKPVMSKRSRVVPMPAQPPKKLSLGEDPRFAQAVQNYEAGLRLMQERKFERAKAAFLKVVAGPSKELADRVTVHLNAVNQSLSRTATTFKSPEEHYDYAVSLMNTGDYDSAREHLEKMAKQYAKTDYIWYGLAVLDALQGHSAEALKHLDEAIKLSPANRIQARNDSDFQSMLDDPRFTELLYPETTEPVDAASPTKSGQQKGR